jgi:hypothetical protein
MTVAEMVTQGPIAGQDREARRSKIQSSDEVVAMISRTTSGGLPSTAHARVHATS